MSHYASAAALFWHRIGWQLGHPELARVTIELQYDGVLPLRDSRGLRVVCLDGVVWITEHNDRKDIVLEPGGAYELSKNGASLILALRSARIAIEAPAMVHNRSALTRVLARAKALIGHEPCSLQIDGELRPSSGGDRGFGARRP